MKKIIYFIVYGFLIYLVHSIVNFKSSDNETKSEYSFSSEGKECAIIDTDKPYSYEIEICRSDFSSESAWKRRIKEVEKAKKHDEFGNSFYVTVQYK